MLHVQCTAVYSQMKTYQLCNLLKYIWMLARPSPNIQIDGHSKNDQGHHFPSDKLCTGMNWVCGLYSLGEHRPPFFNPAHTLQCL